MASRGRVRERDSRTLQQGETTLDNAGRGKAAGKPELSLRKAPSSNIIYA